YFLSAFSPFPIVSDTSVSFNVFPPRLQFTVQPSDVTAVYRDISPAIQVTFKDANAIMITAAPVPVNLFLNGGQGPANLSGQTSTSTVNGLPTFALLPFTTPFRSYFLSAFSPFPIVSDTSVSFNVFPPRLQFTVQPSNVTAVYRDISPAIQVTFKDA